ncbi:Ig-like domain repeat protein [uncultured Methanobrevibacter sp.]|uniref:Ig-like domain repeat protein n=1 Tax=uncultured Methanobrevibacter sp. TaxID=253161 RepID=UPI0025FFA1FE|nr:Ig-like domain repeat protein [uncultured Methanobrevibacter sp.]
MNYKCLILMLFVLFLSMSIVSANEIGDNITAVSDESPIEIIEDIDYVDEDTFEESNVLQSSSQDSILNNNEEDIIVVNNWDELKYYCAQTDKDYTLKLKENTNFYPSDNYDDNQQINIKNNVKIIGGDGSWIGDSSPEPMQLRFLAMQVKDDSKVGLTLINVTFKWIKAGGGNRLPDGMFLKIGGKKNTIIKNCQFYNIITQYGHSCIVHLNKGTATFENCSIINCTNGYGCLSVFNRNGASVAMIVKNCYFENNYGSTEPGCINNCGKLTVYNTTFIKNKSFWWAGAIHTHGGGNTTIYDSSFIDNVAGWNGGALYTYSHLQVYNSVFIGNNCTTNNGGGAIGACEYESIPHIYIEGCLFEDNANNCWSVDSLSDGTGRGGAISLMDKGSLEVRDTTFISNAASIGTAICTLAVGGYGSPDVIIVNNSFINHTRLGDTLNVNLWDTSFKNISDNYYLGNSIVFSNLTLVKLSEGREDATLQINASLKNPTYYDDDILNRTLYDVYINSKYVKTVNSTVFTVDFGDLDICDVYVIPTISNRKSNEVTITITREYVFVSKSNGNDSNNGISRDAPVYSIKRALELANVCQNIILLDGDYSESDVQIDYDVTIKGEGNATLTGATSFTGNANFTLKNLKINNLNSENFIKQNRDNLVISKCIFTNNDAVLIYNNAFASLTNSILLNNSKIVDGNINDCVLDYNWWSNVPSDLGNYVTLNLTSDINALENNQKANVKAVFYLNDGSKYTNLPDINLGVTAFNGVAGQNTVNIDSSFTYTLTAFSDGALTISYNDVNISKSFEFLKSNPSISLTTNDIMFGDDLIITVTTPGDAEGNLTVNIGNLSQTKVIQSVKSTFTFENLKADTYTITLTYTGDKKYLTKDLTSFVSVNKYESTTQLNLSTVNVGEDVIITINTISTSTGNVTLSINNNSTTLTLTDSKAEYTIKNIKRGDYLIRAVYNGDDKYLTSQDSKFIEVDNLNATMTIQAEDITYGDAAVIRVTLNDDASGNITVSIDDKSNQSKVSNGRAEVTFTNLEAGSNKNITVFYSGDDTYFNLTKSATFNIAKADLTFNISSSDIKIGQFGEIVITVPQRTSGTFTIGEDVINIPLSGEISYVIPDLEIGNYTYTATYNGNNYYTVSNTTSFTVSEYPIPQVQNEGFNTQNTHKSQYETSVNGNIAFTIPFDETLSGDLLVDSWGNVYLTTQNGVYAFNQTSQLWYFTSTSAAGNLSGIAIGRDVIIAPKSGDTLYFINQTTGERYGGSNLYQGSSLFAPVVDANATLYIVSEYQYSSEDYKLTIIPYKLWANGGEPTLVSIGNTQPLCSPTLNENIIVVVSDNRLRIIDAKSLQTLAIKTGNYMPIRPIIGDGNVIYAILSDSIVAYNSNGAQVWKTKVTSGAGNILVLDNEQGLYHVNSRGVLYKYDLVDGSQSKFSSLKVTSGVLIDANNNLYFGSNSMFYALDSEGNVLWKSELGSKIIGNPVMDASGLIYVPTENGVTALTYAPLSDPDLKVSVDDIVEGQKATITITWNSQTTGSVSYTVNGEDVTVDAGDAKITKVISGLTNGYYDVSVSYLGDMRFKETSVTKTFVVRSTDDVANNIQFDGNSTFRFSLNNAQGNLTVNVAGKTYTNELTNGQASITIDKLSPGDWDAVVTYSGDRQFNKANRTFSIEIPKYNVTLNEAIVTENIVTRITVALPSDATGNLTLSVGTKKYTEKVTNGNALIIVDDLAAGNYTATLTYSGDSNYESVSKAVTLNPTKISVILDDSNVIVESGAEPKVSIKLNANATGRFTVSIDGEEYSSDISEELIISGLEPGNYTGTITYSGDFRFSKASKEIHVEVPKITLQFNDSNFVVSKLDDGIIVNVTLHGDARGDIMLSVNGTNYTDKLAAGVASVKVTGLTPENWQATVTYAGSDKYEAISKVFVFSIGRVEVSLNDTTLSVICPSPQPVVNVGFDKAVTGNITVTVNDREFLKELINGCASVELTGLHPGNYSATVAYSGDVKYGATEKTIQLEVPKITATLDNIAVKSNVTVPAISVMLPSDATGDLIVNVTDNLYAGKIIDGSCSVEITGLAPGNYTALVSYSGDSNYTAANKTVSLEVPKIIISLNDDNCMWNASQVSVNLSNATGTLTVEIAGKTYTKELNNGSAVVDINNLNPGSYDLRIIYSGDNVYTKAEKLVSLEIPKIKVAFDDGTLTVNSTSVNVDLPFDATGNITVVVSAKSFIKELTDGKATVNIDDLAPGSYNATVTYSGDGKYESATKIINVNVAKVEVELNNNTLVVDSQNVSSGVSINLPEDATGTLTVTVDGKNYTETLTNGKATVNIPELADGSHNITVTYSGDGKYESITKTSVINVNGTVVDNSTNTTGDNTTNTTVVKADPVLIVSAGDVSVGESAVVNVRTSVETGKFIVNVNDVDYELVISNGESSVNIPDLAVGIYNVIARFAGDDKFNEATNSTSFSVLKVNVPVTNETITLPESDSAQYSISLPSDATGTLTVTVDGVPYTQSLSNGKATVNIPELVEGSHNITVSYSGDGKYSPITKSSVVVKKHVPVIKLTASNLNMLYTSGKYFKVRLTSDGQPLANKSVKITINGKTYSKTTDKNGYASIKISLAPKAYTVKATYANLTVTKKVTVKSIITAKNLNAKRSAKTVKIKVTLKKVNGKYLKNKKITLKFNKKTYKVKTNKKGVATFTIKNSVYKKLKVNKKYTYQVIYGKDKVKKNIKFKK